MLNEIFCCLEICIFTCMCAKPLWMLIMKGFDNHFGDISNVLRTNMQGLTRVTFCGDYIFPLYFAITELCFINC